MADETYNGHTNHETWATLLWITSDKKLYRKALQLVSKDMLNIEKDREMELWVNNELFDFDNMTRNRYMMREDIGSLWRVDWRSVVDHLIADLDDDYEGDETPLAMAMEDMEVD